MSLVKLINFTSLGDDRGSLVVLEGNKNIPFEIKRVYYIFGTAEGVGRGYHAHKELEQVAVCITGKCRMILDNGIEKNDVWLDSPDKGVIINKMIWHEMHDFSDDCVMLVVASEAYDESDYIRNYKKFLNQA